MTKKRQKNQSPSSKRVKQEEVINESIIQKESNEITNKIKKMGSEYYHFYERCHSMEFMKTLSWQGPGNLTSYVTELMDECWKFLVLKKVCGKHFISPSPDVDKIWHELLLYTELYENICKVILGKTIHHSPITPCDLLKRYEKTLELYLQHYSTRNTNIWPDKKDWPIQFNAKKNFVYVRISNDLLPHVFTIDIQPEDTLGMLLQKLQEYIDPYVQDSFVYGTTSDISFIIRDADMEKTLLSQNIVDGSIVRAWIRNTLDVRKGNDGKNMQVFVKTLTGKTVTIVVNTLDTIQRIYCLMDDKEHIAPEYQRLIFAGQQLDPSKNLSDYKIGRGDCLHLVLRLRGC